MLHVAPAPFGASGLFGGGERYPLELARALARRDDVNCKLVTFGRHERRLRDDSGLQIHVLRAIGHLGRHPAHPVAPALLANLGGADIVHVHHLRSLPARLAAVDSSIRRRPIVVSDHGLGGGDWLGLLPRLFDRLLAVSSYSASLLAVPEALTRVVYGGVDPQRFGPDPGISRRGVLFVGRLTPHKGVDRLIAALPRGVALTIVGTGGHDRRPPERYYPALLRAMAAERDVCFRGAVDDVELAAIYRRAAVVVAPSVDVTCYGRRIAVAELLGLGAIEAMASGTPVVASRLGGLAEVVADGRTGFLVEPGDVDALRERLELLLADPVLGEEMGEAGRRRVLDRFTWERCAERCVAAYHELLS